MEKFDVIIIGGGPGGLAAAYSLKSAGKDVAVVENDLWGGTCPNRGCDPKKVLLSAVEARDRVAQLQEKGFSEVPTINWTELEQFKETFTDPVSEGSKNGLISYSITALDGTAKFISENQIDVNGDVYQADKFIIATGQKPSILNIPGAKNLLTSNEFLSLKKMPKSITFIGAGYIAFELANIANAAGAEVHIVHHNDRPLKAFDQEFVDAMVKQMESRSIQFHFNVDTKDVVKTVEGYQLQADNLTLDTGLVICATGRIPNIEELDLASGHIESTRRGVVVDEYLQTTNHNVLAIGDAIDKKEPKLTPVSGFEAGYATDYILGKKMTPISYPAIPTLVYGSPKLAKVGLTTQEAQVDSHSYKVVESDVTNWFTYHRINESIAKVKTIFNQNQQLVGATILTEQADELINLLTEAINDKKTHEDITQTIFGYPTVASDLEYFI